MLSCHFCHDSVFFRLQLALAESRAELGNALRQAQAMKAVIQEKDEELRQMQEQATVEQAQVPELRRQIAQLRGDLKTIQLAASPSLSTPILLSHTP